MRDLSPGNIRDVEEPFHSPQIDKGSKVSQGLDFSLNFLPFAESVEDLSSFFLSFILKEKLSGENGILRFSFEFNDFKFESFPNELFRLFD